MKTNVAKASIENYRTIGDLIASQNKLVLLSMEVGKLYTRRELGVLAGIENSAAMRSVNELVKAGDVIERDRDGNKLRKICSHSCRFVGAVMLAMSEAGK